MSELTISLKSVYLHGPVEISLILPESQGKVPCEFYTSGEKYPVLWLLHGGQNDHKDWLYGTNIGRYAVERNVIAVIPGGVNSDFANHPEYADGYMFQDFFFEELMPFVYGWLPASREPTQNFLAGYSMGCAATWSYGLLHPELFGGIAPLTSSPLNYDHLEPYRDMSSVEFRARALADPHAFAAAYGPPGCGIHRKEINMISRFDTVGDFLDSPENPLERIKDGGKLPPVYLTGSSSDKNLAAFREYAARVGVTGITFELTDEDAHCFHFWDKAIQKAMDFFRL